LINMNKENVGNSLQRLHEKTVGELNVQFDAIMKPYREIGQKLHPRAAGRIDSVAIESVHHDLDPPPGAQAPKIPAQKPPSVASRTDTVLVIATSIAEDAAGPGKPVIVHWNLSLDVSNVHGALLISRLSSLR
jgi:hypothetical protein